MDLMLSFISSRRGPCRLAPPPWSKAEAGDPKTFDSSTARSAKERPSVRCLRWIPRGFPPTDRDLTCPLDPFSIRLTRDACARVFSVSELFKSSQASSMLDTILGLGSSHSGTGRGRGATVYSCVWWFDPSFPFHRCD